MPWRWQDVSWLQHEVCYSFSCWVLQTTSLLRD